MAAGIRFNLFGIPVAIDPSFFLIAALLGFGGGTLTFVVTWVVVVFVSVLLHELGHAVAFRLYGQQPQVLLQGMGGLTSGSGPLPFGRDIVVSLAGPLTGLVLLGVPALWLQSGRPLSSQWDLVLRAVVFVNIAWSGVNLLPVLPLDGGQVAASLLRRFKGAEGQQLARVVSMVVAGAAAVYAIRLNYLFGALFAGFFVIQNYTDWRKGQAVAAQEPGGGYAALIGDALARGVPVGELADRLMKTPSAGVDALVHLQSRLHTAGRFLESALVGQRAFAARPRRPSLVAYDVARSWARAGQPDDALDWLERAADVGLAEPNLLDGDRDLASIRTTARYQAVRARMAAAAGRPPPPPVL